MAGPARVVLDASVAVKWFNPEKGSAQAIALRDDHVAGRVVLAAPALIVWEVVNALRYSKEAGSDDLRRALGDLVDLQVLLVEPDPRWMGEAVDEAFRKGITVYDASYLALARHLRARLYTADDRMLAAGAGVAASIASYGARARV